MKLRAVIFDFFGVVYTPLGEDFYRTHIPNYEEHASELRDLGKQADYGLISQDELVRQVAALANMGKADIRRGIVGHWARNQLLLQFITELRTHYKTGLLTNMGAGVMHKYFTQQELAVYFDDVVISGEVGAIKPNQAAYELAAQRLGVHISECLLIDDSAINCQGATEAGMQVICYTSAEQTIAAAQRLLNAEA